MARAPALAAFDALEREVVDHLFAIVPGYAVSLGLHQYDGVLPDLSEAATERWLAEAGRLRAVLTGWEAPVLGPDRAYDRRLLGLLLESLDFDFRDADELRRNPIVYLTGGSLTAYLARAYGPSSARVDAMVDVLGALPRFLTVGRQRLKGPLPRPFVELALSVGDGLPSHFDEAEEFAARAELAVPFRRARAPAQAAVADFLAWLRAEELPRATDDFALGPVRFQTLLRVREGITTPYAEIRAEGEADLARNQARLAAIAQTAGVPVDELLGRLAADHPPPGELLATARRYVEELRAFTEEKELATIPSPATCRVEETPVWGRALSTASLNPPGPFDPVSSEGIYYVTPVDPTWTPAQQEAWLGALNRAMLRNITVHEVFPGHYLQFLRFRDAPNSLARRVYRSDAFTEGWAHYTEQLAIEAGLGAGSPSAEAEQLHDALLRDCRLLAAIGLHTRGMTVAQATELFRTQAHADPVTAVREAVRGTFDPGYFCYTLGKLAILRARGRLLAGPFAGHLRAFHDAVLGFGAPPVGLLEEMLAAPAASRTAR